ncbi:tigger transposable element-derived protein 2-like isoform X2 [Portunus trituberculatus]|nr:tigger transposable element-derived protein 2-like isoform X2 [Portunus trituberculatus]
MTIAEKKSLIAKHESGMRVTDIAAMFKMPASTVCGILKNKELIKAADVAKGVMILSSRRSKCIEEMEKLLLVWINEKQKVGVHLSYDLICKKAKLLHDKCRRDMSGSSGDCNEFKASRGWLENFKTRTGIFVHRKVACVNMDTIKSVQSRDVAGSNVDVAKSAVERDVAGSNVDAAESDIDDDAAVNVNAVESDIEVDGAVNVKVAESDVEDGDAVNVEVAESDVEDGDAVNVEVAESDVEDGDAVNGDAAASVMERDVAAVNEDVAASVIKRKIAAVNGDTTTKVVSKVNAVAKSVKKFSEFVNTGGYVAQQVFRCDEMGLFWKKMPSRTYIAKEEKFLPGHKPMKDKLTLLLCGNACGNCKIKPLLVYHTENPCVFRKNNVMKSKLNVMWRANIKARVTRQFFTEWIYEEFAPSVKAYLQENNLPLKALLVVENTPAHSSWLGR